MSLKNPRVKTIKRLFGVSSRCAFPGCKVPAVDAKTGSVLLQICHIEGKKDGAARYRADQDDEERHGFDNLVLMCGPHHKIIDDNEDDYDVSKLKAYKADAEGGGGPELGNQTIEELLRRLDEPALAVFLGQGAGPKDVRWFLSVDVVGYRPCEILHAGILVDDAYHPIRVRDLRGDASVPEDEVLARVPLDPKKSYHFRVNASVVLNTIGLDFDTKSIAVSVTDTLRVTYVSDPVEITRNEVFGDFRPLDFSGPYQLVEITRNEFADQIAELKEKLELAEADERSRLRKIRQRLRDVQALVLPLAPSFPDMEWADVLDDGVEHAAEIRDALEDFHSVYATHLAQAVLDQVKAAIHAFNEAAFGVGGEKAEVERGLKSLENAIALLSAELDAAS